MVNILKLIEERDNFIKNHDFSKYSIEGIEKIIGDEQTIRLTEAFDNNEHSAIKWFYSPAPIFNGTTPKEYYKINKKMFEHEVEKLYFGEYGV